jgi:hypothetical protein
MLAEQPRRRTTSRRPAAGRPRRRPRTPLAVRLRRVLALTAALALIPVLVSYLAAITQRSDSSLGIRTVEWISSNGLKGFVDSVENFYYSLEAPAKGGPTIKRLPKQVGSELAGISHAFRVHFYRPPNIAPVIHPALPGEGVWRAPFGEQRANPPVLITSYRPEPDYPQVVAGVGWINHTDTSTVLYPGIEEPSVALPNRGPEEVPASMRGKLVATFNSGFKLADSGGGFAIDGHAYAPLKDGQATLVRYTNGSVDVIDWTAGPNCPPNVSYAMQNLPLIVSGGKPNPNLSNGPQWGATLGNAIMVWRSAVGVDRHGNLIYAAADYQTVGSLAQIMIHAGAVRAMELDINSYWPSFITYRGPGAKDPANLLPGMVRSPYRYLTPDDRDFFAVYLR